MAFFLFLFLFLFLFFFLVLLTFINLLPEVEGKGASGRTASSPPCAWIEALVALSNLASCT
jgi:hypothetical protein